MGTMQITATVESTLSTGVHRPACRFCGAGLPHICVDPEVTPIANAYRSSAKPGRMAQFYPLRARICRGDRPRTNRIGR